MNQKSVLVNSMMYCNDGSAKTKAIWLYADNNLNAQIAGGATPYEPAKQLDPEALPAAVLRFVCKQPIPKG
ncbi:hypothetical protein [Caballeronia novacaledonica]|uniref:Uncharacterized protein n=1 Tax=Caballeronia novacaledonica TaxID=1544861 RepID=A0AA37IJX1_9BURK|nr:hypothetical protein [Caballeronia novacaledonica]GJH28151.1 hypothetical protein CBA19CS42_26565 [Caballeronia novacaledonica]